MICNKRLDKINNWKPVDYLNPYCHNDRFFKVTTLRDLIDSSQFHIHTFKKSPRTRGFDKHLEDLLKRFK